MSQRRVPQLPLRARWRSALVSTRIALLTLAILAGGLPAVAEPLPILPPDPAAAVGFQDDVLPVLAANCVACHNARQKEGGLSLETAAAIAAGGDSGPAVVAGRPAESILLVRAAHRDPAADPMPPPDSQTGGRSLSPGELGLLERWIADGAAAGPAAAARRIAWRTLPPGTGPVVAVDVTTDGRLLAAARGGQVSLCDAASGSEVCRLIDPAATGTAAGSGTAAGAGPGAEPAAHRDPIAAVAFSPAGDRLATGSFRTLKLWRRLPPRVRPLGEAAAASALAVSPTGTVVALGLPDGQVALLGSDSSRAVVRQAAPGSGITGLAFAEDGDTLYTLAASGMVAAIRLADGATIGRLDRPGGTASLAVVAGGLATAEPDGVVRLWRLPLPSPADPGERPSTIPEREFVDPRPPAPADAPTTTPGPPAEPACLVASPGLPGRLFAAGGDGRVRLWNAETGELVREFAHGGRVQGLAVSPDGRRLATAGTVAGIKLWNVADGGLVAEAGGDVRLDRRLAAAELAAAVAEQDVEFAATRVAAAEKDIAAAVADRTKAADAVAAAVTRVEEKEQAASAADKGKQDAAAELAAARAAEPLAVAAHAAAVKAQESAAKTAEAAAASEVAVAKAAADPAAVEAAKTATSAVAAAKTATAAAVSQAAAAIQKAKQRIAAAVKKATEAETALAVAQEERTRAETTLAVARRSVEFAELRDQRSREALPIRQAELEAVQQGLVAARWARDTAVREAAAARQRPALAVAFSRDGRWLAGLDGEGRLTVFGGEDAAARDLFDAARPAGVAETPGLIAFAAGGLVVAGAGLPAAEWDLGEAWTLEWTIGGEATPATAADDLGGPPVGLVTAVAFSPDGTVVASGSGRTSRSGEIKLWTAARGLLLRTLPQPHSDTVMALAFSRRGDQLASGGADRVVKVHAVADGSLVRSLEGHAGHVLGVAWQAHGRRLASAGGDHAVKIWDTVTGEQQRTITGPRKEVAGVRFVAATGELLVASADPLVRVYDAISGAVVREYQGAGGFLQAVAAAPPLVAVGDHDGTVRLWRDAGGGPRHVLEPAAAGP